MYHKEMEEYYAQRAPEYEQIYYRDEPARRQEIDNQVAFLRHLADGREILDVACGTGYWTKVAADTAATVTACDLSGEMLEVAGAKQYAGEVRFLRANLGRLPFADHCFDLILLGFWFSHHPRQHYPELFDQLQRVVRRTGLLWLIDNNPPAEGPRKESLRVDSHGNNYKGRRLSDGRDFEILKNYFEKQQLIDIFARHFTIERLVYKTNYWSTVLRPGPG